MVCNSKTWHLFQQMHVTLLHNIWYLSSHHSISVFWIFYSIQSWRLKHTHTWLLTGSLWWVKRINFLAYFMKQEPKRVVQRFFLTKILLKISAVLKDSNNFAKIKRMFGLANGAFVSWIIHTLFFCLLKVLHLN